MYKRQEQEPPPGLPAGLWLADTGCGEDLVSEDVAQHYASEPTPSIIFSTANGKVVSDTCTPFVCHELGMNIKPYILPQTPHVLSVGRRCMEQGCSFLWPAGCRPMMCLPSGKLVQLEVHHFIPYLKSNGDDDDSDKLAAPALAALLP